MRAPQPLPRPATQPAELAHAQPGNQDRPWRRQGPYRSHGVGSGPQSAVRRRARQQFSRCCRPHGRKVVHRIAGLTEPQGVAYELSTDTLFVANGGDGSVRLFRGGDSARPVASRSATTPTTSASIRGTGQPACWIWRRRHCVDRSSLRERKIADFPFARSPGELSARSQHQPNFVNVPTCEGDRGARQRQRSTEGDLAR